MPSPLALKELCRSHGIYTLASLAAFMAVAPKRSQAQIARLTKQSDSSVGQWIADFKTWDLISCTYRKEGNRVIIRDMEWSATGRDLAIRIRSLLQP
jgi:hypothetical protein